MLFDLAQTNKSFLRQSKMDVLKTHDVLALEKPVETALLMGLSGLRNICVNQWHCTLQENSQKLDDSMKDLLANGLTIGQTVRLLHIPYRRPKPEEEETGEEVENQSKTETEKEKGDESTELANQSKESEKPVPSYMWYNMVTYGAPNMLVTQVSKP